MTVISKSRIGPDLAVGANMGAASSKRESIIEPVHGTRKVLAIVIDPQRPDHPAADRDFMAGLEPALFGERRVQLTTTKLFPEIVSNLRRLRSWDHMLPTRVVQCRRKTITGISPIMILTAMETVRTALMSTGALLKRYLLRHSSRRSTEFDFSEYDLDRDSVITSNELAILIVIPQTSSNGSECRP